MDEMVYRHSVVVVAREGNGREDLWGSPSITEGKVTDVCGIGFVIGQSGEARWCPRVDILQGGVCVEYSSPLSMSILLKSSSISRDAELEIPRLVRKERKCPHRPPHGPIQSTPLKYLSSIPSQ